MCRSEKRPWQQLQQLADAALHGVCLEACQQRLHMGAPQALSMVVHSAQALPWLPLPRPLGDNIAEPDGPNVEPARNHRHLQQQQQQQRPLDGTAAQPACALLLARLPGDDAVELDEAYLEAARHQRHHQRALDGTPAGAQQCCHALAGQGHVDDGAPKWSHLL